MKTETREQKIKRYMKLSKMDLIVLLLGSQYAFDQIVKGFDKSKPDKKSKREFAKRRMEFCLDHGAY